MFDIVPHPNLSPSIDPLQLLKAVVDASPEGMLAATHDGQVLVWNQAFLTIFSLPENYCSFSVQERFQLLTREIKVEPRVMDFLREAYQKNPATNNLEMQARDGRVILLSATPLNIPGQPPGILWTCRDLTSLRKAEQSRDDFLAMYQHLFESVHEGLSLYQETADGHRQLVDCNQRYVELSGRSKQDLLACADTRIWQKNLATDQEHFGNLQKYFHSEPWKGYFRWERPDRKVNFLAYSATPLEIQGEKYTFGIDWDITDLILARDQSDHALQTKTHFLARASHEIRTPLTTLLGYADLLQEQELSPGAQESVRNIVLSGKMLFSLVNDLLDLSKVENGQMEISPRWTDLTAIMTDLESLFDLQFRQKGILWSAEFPEKCPLVWMDPIRIRQILVNLLGNVLKFVGTGWVDLRMTRSSPGNGVVFTLSGDHFTLSDDEGDLGLMIAKRLIELMDGTLTLTRASAAGTLLAVEFPQAVWQSGEEESSMGPAGVPKLLLIADDDISNRVLIKGFLRDSEYQVIEAVNGKEAVELCQQYNPQLILMDLKMPVLSGRDAAEQLRNTLPNRKMKIVAMTAADYQDSFLQVDSPLWDDYLNKPFSRQRLFELLRTHLP